MFINTAEGASAISTAPTFAADIPPSANDQPNRIRHLIFGTPTTVKKTIRLLHQRGYAEPNDWSRPISTGRTGEVMAILTKRI